MQIKIELTDKCPASNEIRTHVVSDGTIYMAYDALLSLRKALDLCDSEFGNDSFYQAILKMLLANRPHLLKEAAND